MTTSASAGEVLTGDDELYDELYDVRREAEEVGNYIDVDPYPLMNAAREQGAVQEGFLRQILGLPAFHRQKGALERQGFTCFTFEACDQAFRDNVNYSNNLYSLDRPSGDGPKPYGILEMDNPEHHAFRRAVQSLFIKPKAQKWWRENFIDALVDDLVRALHGQDRAELNLQLCARVPVHTITRAVGLRGEDALVFRNALLQTSANKGGIETQMKAHATVQRMLMEQIELRHQEPGTDIISWLLAAEIDPPGEERRHLTDQEVVVFARLILLAGGGTTWRQLGIVLLALLTNPDQYHAAREDRKLIDAAIEESLRWNPTNPLFTRLAAADTEFHGVFIPKGSILDICLGAANRDPARWDNPEVFDLHRPFQQHLGTGIGAHMCLGRFVAHVEMGVTINRLFDEFPNLRLDKDFEEPFVTGGLEQRGVSALHVRLQ
ncbi:cytochrome P450 [Novosphingobium sp. M1R2S20]|uniref:Cytochrome P450 n=1 Tax=Novosphingobium rhizovicinum TaxID=3228928 RepID=A0ABV3RH56_9SPHN